MKIAWTVLIVLAITGFGYLLCPTTAGLHAPDAAVVLRKAISAQNGVEFHAEQRYSDVSYGKRRSYALYACGSTYLLSKAARSEWARRIALVEKNYTPLIEGQDTIAGRETWLLRLKPNIKDRPWRQIWVDKKTYVTLASRDWTARNTVKASMKTLSVDYGRNGHCHSFKMAAGTSLRGYRASKLPQSSRRPHYLPDGFELATVEVDSKRAGTQLVYTDGLFDISVFHGHEADSAALKMKPMVVSDAGEALVCLAKTDGHNALVVADLPVAEIEKIAGSIR